MRVKFKHAEMQAFINTIGAGINYMRGTAESDEDYVIIAVLEEMHLKLSQKFIERKAKYSFGLKPAQGFAIRSVYAGSARDSFEGNLIGRICDDVHQIYAFK